MPKCPNCGSTAQVKVTGTNFVEDGWEITLYRHYECGCGCRFYGTSVFHCQDQYELIEKKDQKMKTSNYFYTAHSQMYGMLHGMHTGGCLDNLTLEDAQDIARSEAYDVVTGYDCIMEAIHDDLNERFGYDDTPDNPDEEYLDELEASIEEECEYSLYEITPEGEAHWDEMEADYESVDDYLRNGWLKNC